MVDGDSDKRNRSLATCLGFAAGTVDGDSDKMRRALQATRSRPRFTRIGLPRTLNMSGASVDSG